MKRYMTEFYICSTLYRYPNRVFLFLLFFYIIFIIFDKYYKLT